MLRGNLLESIRMVESINLPDDLILYTKRHVLDAIGSAMAGAQTKIGQEIIQRAKTTNGTKEATIIGDGGQISATSAFEANSRLGRLRDSSDGHVILPDHLTPNQIYFSMYGIQQEIL